MPTSKESAHAYASLGWQVFPLHNILPNGSCSCGTKCNDPGKHPRVPWKTGKTTDQDQIDRWFSEWPDANIGIATGKQSGLWVLDLDNKQSVDIGDGLLIGQGEHSLKALENEHGTLPDTLVSITGSGGNHFFFRYPDEGEYRNRTGLAPGIDVRAEGGYVVAPPSNHMSGNRYEFVDPFVALAAVPDWLLTISLKSRGVAALDEGEKVGEGGRNEYLFRMGSKLRGEKNLNYIELFGALMAYNLRDCNPALDEDEVGRIAKNVASLSANEPEPLAMIGSGRQVFDQNSDMQAGDDLACSLHGLMTKELNPPTPLVHGLMDAGTGILLAGAPNVGKTWLAMDLALAVATGTTFLDRPTKQSSVLYIDEEGSEYGDKQRLGMLLEGRGLGDTGEIPLHLAIGRGFKIDTPRGQIAIRRMITRYRPELIIIDSLVRVQQGEENSSRDMAAFFAIAKRIMDTTGAAMLFIHHVRKPGKDDSDDMGDLIRGSSEIRAFFDTIIIAKENRETEGIEVHDIKQRWRKKAAPSVYKIEVEEERSAAITFLYELPETSSAKDTQATRLFIARKIDELMAAGHPATANAVAGATGRSITSIRSHLEAMSAPGGVLDRYEVQVEFGSRGRRENAYKLKERSPTNSDPQTSQLSWEQSGSEDAQAATR